LAIGIRIFLILFVGIWLCIASSACKKETPAPKSAPPVPPVAPVAATPPAAPPAPAPTPAEKPAAVYAYNPQGRPDPFLPLILPQEGKEEKKGLKGLAVSELKLSGIVWDKKEYVALVEAPDGLGYVLKVNDLIGSSARVARIAPHSVVFEVKEKPYLPNSRIREFELKLKKEE
jgi:type IV pilus assembly protein PilP